MLAGDLLVILGERALIAGELATEERGLGFILGVVFCGCWYGGGGCGGG